MTLTNPEDMKKQIKELLEENTITDGDISVDYEFGKIDIRVIMRIKGE